MIIKYKKTITEDVEVDIDFPIYRKYPPIDNQENDIWHYKVTKDLVEIGIYFYDSKNFHIEVDRDVDFNGEEDYVFGRGKYACSEEEFNEAYNKVLDGVRSVF